MISLKLTGSAKIVETRRVSRRHYDEPNHADSTLVMVMMLVLLEVVLSPLVLCDCSEHDRITFHILGQYSS